MEKKIQARSSFISGQDILIFIFFKYRWFSAINDDRQAKPRFQNRKAKRGNWPRVSSRSQLFRIRKHRETKFRKSCEGLRVWCSHLFRYSETWRIDKFDVDRFIDRVPGWNREDQSVLVGLLDRCIRVPLARKRFLLEASANDFNMVELVDRLQRGRHIRQVSVPRCRLRDDRAGIYLVCRVSILLNIY